MAGVILAAYWIPLAVGTHVPLPSGTIPSGTDKTVHLAAYTGLAFLLAWWLSTTGRTTTAACGWALAIAAVYAVVDELLQIPVNRSAEVYDGLSDWAGALIGVVIFRSIQAVWKKSPSSGDGAS